MSPCTVTALYLSLPDTLLQDVEMPLVLLMDQVPRPLNSDDKLLDQEAIVSGNVAVGSEQASMYEAMIEGDQGQGQMVEQCSDMTVVEADTSPSYLGMLRSHLPVLCCASLGLVLCTFTVHNSYT